jgi:hypothetical protein
VCNSFVVEIERKGEYSHLLCFTGEKFFHLGGELNVHNMMCYSDANPNYKVEKPNAYGGVLAWCTVTWNELIGPFFPENKTNSEVYQEMLENEFLPKLRKRVNPRRTWFQHNVARAHTAQTTQQYLNGVFGKHWIGKGSDRLRLLAVEQIIGGHQPDPESHKRTNEIGH